MSSHKTEALGKYILFKAYIDDNQALNILNRWSHINIIIDINNAPIIWYNKYYNIVETSSFGFEFVVISIMTDIIEALQ